MKVITVIALSLLVLIVACSKDKFETKPRIELKELSTTELFQGQTLTMRLDYFDKEGDLNKGLFTTIIVRQNLLPIGQGQDKVDTLDNQLPDYPGKDKGEISYTLDWNFLKESLVENDTLIFKYAVRDLAGNSSDTISSERVVIHMP